MVYLPFTSSEWHIYHSEVFYGASAILNSIMGVVPFQMSFPFLHHEVTYHEVVLHEVSKTFFDFFSKYKLQPLSSKPKNTIIFCDDL